MLDRVLDFIRALFHRSPVRLAIVRRYADANGSYVGELYMEQAQNGVSSYRMIGASLDTLPLDWKDAPEWIRFHLDLEYDFLGVRHGTKNIPVDKAFFASMSPNTIRVGALDPRDNDRVRKMIGRLPRKRMSLVIQNRFIEHVMEKQNG